MIVYHVTSYKKLQKYLKSGRILSPVKGWMSLEHAQRFSISTHRRIILRLKFPDNAPYWPGHYNDARVIYNDYPLTEKDL